MLLPTLAKAKAALSITISEDVVVVACWTIFRNITETVGSLIHTTKQTKTYLNT